VGTVTISLLKKSKSYYVNLRAGADYYEVGVMLGRDCYTTFIFCMMSGELTFSGEGDGSVVIKGDSHSRSYVESSLVNYLMSSSGSIW
jgi:hypothetical protein